MKVNVTFTDLTENEAAKLFEKLAEPSAQTELPFTLNAQPVPSPYEIKMPIDTTPEATVDVDPVTDKSGLPWDERIHSSNKKLTAKGEWTRRRGVDDITFETVKAELLGCTEQEEPEVTVPSFLPSTPTPAPVATKSFADLMNTIGTVVASGKADNNYIRSITERIAQAYNTPVASVTDIMNNQQMIDYAFSLIEHDGKLAA